MTNQEKIADLIVITFIIFSDISLLVMIYIQASWLPFFA